MTELWGAFLVGLMSSFHCVGMCGPLALSVPQGIGTKNAFINSFAYNFGRIATYSFLGIFVGLFGRLFFYSGLQQILSITVGSIIVLVYILPAVWVQTVTKRLTFVGFFAKLFSFFYKRSGALNAASIGVLNGFLPCGFVFLAAANALVAPTVTDSVVYMFCFGLGTFPLMFLLTVSKNFLSLSTRNALRKIVPYFAVLMGIMLILRGLELGIPYISPAIEYNPNGVDSVDCAPKQ